MILTKIQNIVLSTSTSKKDAPSKNLLSGSQNSEILDVNPTVELVLKESIEKKYIDIHDEGSSLVERLVSYGIGPRVSRKLIDNFDEAVIKANVEYSLKQAKVKNMAGYIRKAIENNYASSKQISQRSQESREKIFTNKLMELGVGRIGLLPALQGLAALCEVEIIDLVKK